MTRSLLLALCLIVAAPVESESRAATPAGARLRPAKARKPALGRAKRLSALVLAALMFPGTAGAVGPVFDPATQAQELVIMKWDPPVPGVGRVRFCHSSVTPYTSANFAERWTLIKGAQPTTADSYISGKVSVWYEGQHYFKAVQYKDIQLPGDWEQVNRCGEIPGKTHGRSVPWGFMIGSGVGSVPKPPVLR